MKSIGNMRTVSELLAFYTRHEGNWTEGCVDPGPGKCVRSRQMRILNKTEKENVDLERSTFLYPKNLLLLEKRMDVRLTMQI